MDVLGVDVGGRRKGLDLVLLDERRVPSLVVSGAALSDLELVLEERRPAIVAIDAPPRWAAAGRSRLTERELHRVNIHALPTPSQEHGAGSMFDWMRHGFEAFDVALRAGYPPYSGGPLREGMAVEVFPHGSAVVLAACLPPREVTKRAFRGEVLRRSGVATDDLRTLDQIDAALAALTGLIALGGCHSHLGDAAEGAIVLPASGPPLARYRRGPWGLPQTAR